jgi:hypothetical protein
LNRYSYVRNSPLVYSDPGGHGPPYPVVLGGEMPVQWELYHAAYYAKAIFYENFTYEEYSAAYTAGVIHAYGAGAEGYGSLASYIAEGAANALVGREDENWATVQFAMWDAMMGGSPSAAAFAQASGQQVSTLYDAATLYAGSGGLTGGRLEGWNQYSSVPDAFDSRGRSLTCPPIRSRQGPWKVGDPINTPTRNGYPSWGTVRRRYWKSEAFYYPGECSAENLARMRRGLAPQDPETGASKHLHHIGGRDIDDPHNQSNLRPLWPWEHYAQHYGDR